MAAALPRERAAGPAPPASPCGEAGSRGCGFAAPVSPTVMIGKSGDVGWVGCQSLKKRNRGNRKIPGASPAGVRLELDRDRPGGSGPDRVRESEFVGPKPGSPKRIGRERPFVPIMFRKSEPGTEESRAEGRNAGPPRFRAVEAEAGEISAALRPGPEGRPRQSRAARSGRRFPACRISPSASRGAVGPSGGSACRQIATLTKQGIAPSTKTRYVANRREEPRF